MSFFYSFNSLFANNNINDKQDGIQVDDIHSLLDNFIQSNVEKDNNDGIQDDGLQVDGLEIHSLLDNFIQSNVEKDNDGGIQVDGLEIHSLLDNFIQSNVNYRKDISGNVDNNDQQSKSVNSDKFDSAIEDKELNNITIEKINNLDNEVIELYISKKENIHVYLDYLEGRKKASCDKDEKEKLSKLIDLFKRLSSNNVFDYWITSRFPTEFNNVYGNGKFDLAKLPTKIESEEKMTTYMFGQPNGDSSYNKNHAKFNSYLNLLEQFHNFAPNDPSIHTTVDRNKQMITTIDKHNKTSVQKNKGSESQQPDVIFVNIGNNSGGQSDQSKKSNKFVTKYNEVVKYLNENKNYAYNAQQTSTLYGKFPVYTTHSNNWNFIFGIENMFKLLGSKNLNDLATYSDRKGNINPKYQHTDSIKQEIDTTGVFHRKET